MSLIIPCSFCGRTNVGKYSSATWAWVRADGVRVAWRQRLCVDCYCTNIAVLDTAVREDPLSCPACHTQAGDDMDPCYLTVFVPGVGPCRYEFATCGPDAAELRIRAQKGGTLLPDRPASSGGLDPSPQESPAIAVWKALGIEPRE